MAQATTGKKRLRGRWGEVGAREERGQEGGDEQRAPPAVVEDGGVVVSGVRRVDWGGVEGDGGSGEGTEVRGESHCAGGSAGVLGVLRQGGLRAHAGVRWVS